MRVLSRIERTSTPAGLPVARPYLLPLLTCAFAMLAVSSARAAQIDPQTEYGSNDAVQQPIHQSITELHSISVVASTVDPKNSDQNPYGLVIVPKTAAQTGSLLPGDLLVSNINNVNNVMGLGTTVELIRPTDSHPMPKTFFSGAVSPIAMVLNANATSLWIANYGLNENGFTGNVDVVNNNGMLFAHGSIDDPRLEGSWGQGFNGQSVGGSIPPVFFDTNTLTGAVYRLQHFVSTSQGPDFSGATITQIATLGHSGTTINNVVGPQGMAWSKANDTLYIADPVNNRIVAVPNSTTTTSGSFYVVFEGHPLNQPAGIALNPINGDMLVVNQGDNKLIEIAPSASADDDSQIVGIRILDKTKVINGVGSALFGLAATTDASGNLVVYFTNDNTNTVNLLSASETDQNDVQEDGQ